MARFLLTLVGLLACLALSHSRMPTGDFFDERIEDVILRMQTLGRHGGGGTTKDDKIYFSIRYTVPPSEHDAFLSAWQDLEDRVKNDKDIDVIRFELSKYITDNIVFREYSEWDNMEDLVAHCHKGHTRDFHRFTAKHEIKWELQPLKNVTGESERGQAYLQSANKKRRAEDLTHVMITYNVPAMHHGSFLDTWSDTAACTWREDTNHIYGLRKVATDNTRFIGYGVWDSYEDWLDHFTSKHVQKLKDFVADKDIEWFLTPVRPLSRFEL